MGLEQGAFAFGAATYPLTASTENSLLSDADPALFAALDFLSAVLDNYLSQRLKTQSGLLELKISQAVCEKFALEPTPFLLSDQFKFPLFSIYRVKDVWDEQTISYDRSTATWQFAYVLPPLNPVESKALQPILRGVSTVLRRAIHRGADPSYNNDEPVWHNAGLHKARLLDCTYGGYAAMQDNAKYFRALTGTISVMEREMPLPGAFDVIEGTSADINLQTGDEPIYEDIVELATHGPPAVTSVSPTNGTTAGGTLVTITGTGFQVGTRPIVLFDGAAADAVTVMNGTTLTCRTPPHDAFPMFVADVMVIANNAQRATLQEAFTFQAA